MGINPVEVLMVEVDIAVEVVEIDPNNKYFFLEGPGINGKIRVKVQDPAPPDMEVGDNVYVTIKTWYEWCALGDTGALDSD